ncbi:MULTISPECIES: L,D-transpeptidase family protein [unclassified Psychrobacter]|uniref:L,D-transpeptidase family protein n=1 Tax=unclassified Psychrobacter TaxID=196806 RepID=UPI0025B4EE89|nr:MULTISPECIES: L,D-transpeptidase family protein [unclassified Psychrobacter]MDN3453583.1 L,D-transpeptidase family protein [Psychrobacter sp. APC 3350]MDN3502187.1 L,D-transpeptidase family protein [Psychrobacter sp. 5A.1]
MYQLKKISIAVAMIGLSTAGFVGQSVAAPSDSTNVNNQVMTSIAQNTADQVSADKTSAVMDVSPVTNGVSQKLTGDSKAEISLNKLLPTIKYTTENLSKTAEKVNNASWKEGDDIDHNIATKLQALLNWHHNSVGSVDGYWGKNTRKAMQTFQQANGMAVTEALNVETWQALTKDEALMAQPVLVSYQLSEADVNIKTTDIPAGAEAKASIEGLYYESITEALAEKFHISEKYLKALNPNANFTAGEIITVYNPGNPNTKPVHRVVTDKTTKTLYAYDDKGNLVASYPTTVGSTATPSPTGTHTVEVKVHEPNYTYTAPDGRKSILPPGPNNPVGSVWIGLSKPSYGIHGSPDPAHISRQASAGCIRLTNWDALSLLGVIKNGATVEIN